MKMMTMVVSPITLSGIMMTSNSIIRLSENNLLKKFLALIIIRVGHFITDLVRQMSAILSRVLFPGWLEMMLRNMSIKTLYTLNKTTWVGSHKGMRLGVARVGLNSLNLTWMTPVYLELTSISI